MPPETPRFLHLSASLRSGLLLYRIRHEVVTDPVLDRTELDRIEKELGTCLPDNVLAAFAASGIPLTEALRSSEHARRWSSLPQKYTAFAHKAHDEREVFWCILTARRPLARLGVYRWMPERPANSHAVTSASWLTQWYDLTPPTDDELALVRKLAPQFYPRVEGPFPTDSRVWPLGSPHI